MNKIKNFFNVKLLLCFLGVVLILIYQFQCSVMAETNQYYEANCYISFDDTTMEGYPDDVKRYSFINKKVCLELDSHNTFLEPELEKYLNKNGIFDEDIDEFDSNTINQLSKVNLEDIDIKCGYFAVVDSEQMEDVKILPNELYSLSQDEVNAYFGKQYFDVETFFSDNILKKIHNTANEQNVAEKILQNVGIIPVKCYAKAYDVDLENVSILKVSHVVVNYTNYCNVSTVLTWQPMPKYRQIDTSVISWGDALIMDRLSANVTCSAYYTITKYTLLSSKLVSTYSAREVFKPDKNLNPLNIEDGQYCPMEHALTVVVDLPGDSSYSGEYLTYKEYNKYTISISYELNKTNVPKTSVPFYFYYNHTYTKKTYDFDLTDAVSIVVSIGKEDYYSAVIKIANGYKESIKSEKYSSALEHYFK